MALEFVAYAISTATQGTAVLQEDTEAAVPVLVAAFLAFVAGFAVREVLGRRAQRAKAAAARKGSRP